MEAEIGGLQELLPVAVSKKRPYRLISEGGIDED